MDGGVRILEPHDGEDQHDGPNAEDRLDLAKEMQHLPAEAHLIRLPVIVAIAG